MKHKLNYMSRIVNEKGENQEDEMEAMQQMSKNMTFMLPFMSVTIAFIAPLGLALYWLVSNVLMIIERIVLNKMNDKKEETQNA